MHHQVFQDSVSFRVSVSVCLLTAAVRERVSKIRPPQLSSTSCWVNCRQAADADPSSAKWKGFLNGRSPRAFFNY